MGWAFGEAAADAALTYIDTNSAAKLTTVAARYGDGITLPAFKATRMSDPYLEAEPEFPVLYAMPERDVPDPAPNGLAKGFLLQSDVVFIVVYELSVDQTGNGTTEAETLRRMGVRYAVAVMEMLAESIASTGVHWGTGRKPEIYYGVTFTNRQRATLLSDVQIRIGAMRRETSL